MAEDSKKIEGSFSTFDDGMYSGLIKAGYTPDVKGQVGSNGQEVIDIITEYYWTQNKPKMINSNDVVDVPFLYAIEYKQRYGVTATNLFNNVVAISNAVSRISDKSGITQLYSKGKNAMAGAFDKMSTTISSALEHIGAKSVKDAISGGIGSVANAVNTMFSEGSTLADSAWAGNGFLNTTLLSPYFYLYSLEHTNKKYCFPFFTEGASSWNIGNSFNDQGASGLLSKALSTAIDKVGNGMVQFASDVQDISNFMSGNRTSGFTMYNIEKAKAFSFPTGGKTVSVRFPLFNTVAKNEWKKNYRFIVLFASRNMLFRKNNVEYYPPLFYDVSVPGFGRMPLCYVKTFSVKPVGMTRIKSLTLDLDFLTTTQKETTVIVPEAWIVQIDFESLIAESANQFLSSVIDLPVNAKIQL